MNKTFKPMHRQDLQGRWTGEVVRIRKILSALKAGADWTPFLGAFESNGIAYGPLIFANKLKTGKYDLRGLPLEGADLSRIQIEGVDLEFSQFFKVGFEGAIMSSVKRPSNLRNVSFLHCRFAQAQFQGVNCTNTHFGHCDLSDANFSGAALDTATFRSSNLLRANFVCASLRNVNFIHSNLREINVSEETTLGVDSSTASSEHLIQLEDQARNMRFDRFQFANQREAFEGAAQVYGQLADAWLNRGLIEAGELWRLREQECLQLASELRHV